MLLCWNASPQMRPSFNDLEERVSLLLRHDIVQRFIDLNFPYSTENVNHTNSDQADNSVLNRTQDFRANDHGNETDHTQFIPMQEISIHINEN